MLLEKNLKTDFLSFNAMIMQTIDNCDLPELDVSEKTNTTKEHV